LTQTFVAIIAHRSAVFYRRFSICNLLASFIFVGLIFIAPARAQQTRIVIDSLRLKENYLALDFHVDSLLTTHLLLGMKRGLTSAAQFRVQLWRQRRHWFGSTLMMERQYEIKSAFEPWEQKYVILTAGERRLTAALNLVRHGWEQHQNVILAELKEFNPGRRYFVTIELLVEPVSKESLNEIRGWLAGEVKAVAAPDSAADDSTSVSQRVDNMPDRLLNLLINLTGFGKQIITAQTKNFEVDENRIIIWEK
jgi:hypothetical protein